MSVLRNNERIPGDMLSCMAGLGDLIGPTVTVSRRCAPPGSLAILHGQLVCVVKLPPVVEKLGRSVLAGTAIELPVGTNVFMANE